MSKLFTSPNRFFYTLATLGLLAGFFIACNSAPSPAGGGPTPAGTFAPTAAGTFAPTAAGTFAPAPAGTFDPACASVTDAMLIKEISDKIKADPQFKSQLGHIAVNSKNRVVMLLGWAKGEAAVATLSQYAGAVKCVSKVESRLNTRLTVGCGNDQEDCPGVGCVPIGQCAPPVGTGN